MSKSGFQLILMAALMLMGLRIHSTSSSAQTIPERYWLAGRYDGNRIIVYFDAVEFGTATPSDAVQIAPPVAIGFFDPVALSAGSIAKFQTESHREHFALGDRYDLLLGRGGVATFTLTTLVGFIGDEQVGNDSYIGALGTLDSADGLLFQGNYYVVRRHRESSQPAGHAGLVSEPVRFDLQEEVASQLNALGSKIASTDARFKIGKISPAFTIQPFTVLNGSLRYYVRAEWKAEQESDRESAHALAAWMRLQPALRVLAVETQTASYGFEEELPILRNVIDLGGAKTGMVVSISNGESVCLNLMEYRDGVDLAHMRTLQSIRWAE